ncbi:MAG TPA: damage repair protein [Bacilli bacterium]|nr:damage repair protein [Bacilli bacterium]HPS19254.1 damage repair protein [Bacilli bacterium]
METETRNIIVIDLKAFYSFVECIDRGLDPWTTPLVVADKERGKNTIVLSVTPFLKAQGIPSRLRVKELPSNLEYIYARPRMERYIEMSTKVVDIFLDFVSEDDIHIYSIDEAFLDLTSYLNYYQKSAMEITEMILGAIKERTGLYATAGIGDNFFLAKVALDIYAKKEKNGIATVRQKDVKTKLWTISPLSEMWGIGARTEAKLNKLGIFSVKELALSSPSFLTSHFGIMGEQLHNHANGIDESDIHEKYIPESTSLTVGQSLFKNYNKENIVTIIREMCDDLSERLRQEKKKSSRVSLFIGYANNQGGFSRQTSLLSVTDETEKLFDALMEIFNRNASDLPIRNVGINFSSLANSDHQQLDLFEDQQKQIKNRELLFTIDEIHHKFGKNILLRASSLTDDSTTRERHEQIGGHHK